MQTRWAMAMMVSAVVISGCAKSEPPAPPPPPPQVISPQTAEASRQAFLAENPGAKAGFVGDVLEGEPFISVNGSNVDDFPLNSVVTVADNDLNLVAHGVVVKSEGEQIHVRYEGQRPKTGQLVLRIPSRPEVAPPQ